MLLLGPTQTDRKKFRGGQKTPYYNRPTQDGLSGHFVLRAIGKRFRKDRTAGCEKVVGIRFALDSSLEGDGFELSVPASVSFVAADSAGLAGRIKAPERAPLFKSFAGGSRLRTLGPPTGPTGDSIFPGETRSIPYP